MHPTLGSILSHPTVLVILGLLVGAFVLYKAMNVLSRFVKLGMLLGLLAGMFYLLVWLKTGIHKWQLRQLHSHPVATKQKVGNTVLSVPSGPVNLHASSPLVQQSPWIVAAAILFLVVFFIGYLFYRSMDPKNRAEFLNNLRRGLFLGGTGKSTMLTDGEYPLAGVELGIDKQTGKPITIEGKDRFINTLVQGAIGTGKSSRVLKKGVYQDLMNIANGTPMDCIVVDPDGSLVDGSIDMAERLGIPSRIIDMRGQGARQSTVSFDPFTGGDIADIVDNVRAVLSEQMGHQEAFFQIAQDDLVRTVIQVQLPLWPETDFIGFSGLVIDPDHFRQICLMLTFNPSDHEPKRGKKKIAIEDFVAPEWREEIAYVKTKYASLPPHVRSMVMSAAKSFLADTRTEAKMEHLEKVTKGLKMVVNEISTNPKMRQVLERGELPVLDLQKFLHSDKRPGELIAVITGNRPVGDLFGKLFLVSLKMYGLSRPGSEDTRRPNYLWVDEFPRFATESLKDFFAQARKYRIAATVAIQARSQLQLNSNQGFVNVVEGSCRNKIYFPAPAPEDAKYLEETLGTVENVQTTYQENRLGVLLFDNRNLDRRVSQREQVDPRYRIENLLYSLSKEEAVFVMTQDNQAQVPTVGITSYADEWVTRHLKRHRVKKRSQRNGLLPEKSVQQSTTTLAAATTTIPNTPQQDTMTTHSWERRSDDLEAMPQVGLADFPKTSNKIVEKEQEPTVIPLSVLMGSTGNRESKAEEESTVQQTPNLTPQISVEDKAQSPVSLDMKEQAAASTALPDDGWAESDKDCPQCDTATRLLLSPDGSKYRCPRCGFRKGNRKHKEG